MLGKNGLIDYQKKEPKKVSFSQLQPKSTLNNVITDVANNFLNRINARLLATTFQRWQQVLTTHQNASEYAIQYDEAHLQSRTLLAWRLKLHDRLQMAKVARWANKYFVTRNALHTWISILEDRRKVRKLREFEVAKMGKIFDSGSCCPNLSGDDPEDFSQLGKVEHARCNTSDNVKSSCASTLQKLVDFYRFRTSKC